MENKEKIKIATELFDTTKDYLEFLKVRSKLKQKFNADVIDNQININEKEIITNANKLRN